MMNENTDGKTTSRQNQPERPVGASNPWIAVGLLCTVFLMDAVDFTIIQVTLPTLQQAFGFSEVGLQWVVTIYALMFGGFMLLAGRVADFYGRRRLFMGGVAVFALGSITAALAPTPEVLLGGRAFQGLGAAVTTPTAVSIITNIFPPGSKRNRALAAYAAVGAAGSSFGLVLGGIITSFLNWQWNFFINVPIAAVVLLLAPRYVPPSRDSEEVTFDVLGAVTLTGGLLAGVYAITEVIHYGWSDPRILGTTAASAILLGSFVVHERRVSDPLVPFDVFHPRSMKIAIVATVALAGGVVSLLFFGTQYFQSIHQYTALRTGLAFLPMGLTSLLISIYLSGQLLSQYGLGPILAGGMGLAAVGFGYLSMVPIDGSYWVAFLPGLTVMAAGYGLAMPCVTVGAVADIDEARHGLATGIQQTAGQVGAGAGFALYVMIAATLTVFGSGDGVSGAKALGGGFNAAMATAAVVAGAAALAALTLRSGIGVDSTASEPATDRQVPMPEPSD